MWTLSCHTIFLEYGKAQQHSQWSGPFISQQIQGSLHHFGTRMVIWTVKITFYFFTVNLYVSIHDAIAIRGLQVMFHDVVTMSEPVNRMDSFQNSWVTEFQETYCYY